MDIRELEKSVRSAIRTAPMEPALAALAGDGKNGTVLSAEFDTAVKSLLKRPRRGVSRSNGEGSEAAPWF